MSKLAVSKRPADLWCCFVDTRCNIHIRKPHPRTNIHQSKGGLVWRSQALSLTECRCRLGLANHKSAGDSVISQYSKRAPTAKPWEAAWVGWAWLHSSSGDGGSGFAFINHQPDVLIVHPTVSVQHVRTGLCVFAFVNQFTAQITNPVPTNSG